MLSNKRSQRASGKATALLAHQRARKVDAGVVEARWLEQPQHENGRLKWQLAQAQKIIEVCQNLSNLSGLTTALLTSETV